MKKLTGNVKYDLALSTILILIVVIVVQNSGLKLPETVEAYEAVKTSEMDKFQALWDEETDKVYKTMYPEARIRALTNISNKTGEVGAEFYSNLKFEE